MLAVLRPPRARLDPAQAAALAGRLQRAATGWTRTFLVEAHRAEPDLAVALRRETLAYGLALLAQRLGQFDPAQAGPFLELVRQACAGLEAGPSARPGRGALAAPPPADTEFDRQWLACAVGGPREFVLTPEMFREFSELTGLGSSDLVGGGENLAALVFYLVIHGRVFASRGVPLAQRRRLVRTLQDCRLFLARVLDQWLASLL